MRWHAGRLWLILAFSLGCLADSLDAPDSVSPCEPIVITQTTDMPAHQLMVLNEHQQVVIARLNFQTHLPLQLLVPSGRNITLLLVDRTKILASLPPLTVQNGDTSCFPNVSLIPQHVTKAFWSSYGDEMQKVAPENDYSGLPGYFRANSFAAQADLQASIVYYGDDIPTASVATTPATTLTPPSRIVTVTRLAAAPLAQKENNQSSSTTQTSRSFSAGSPNLLIIILPTVFIVLFACALILWFRRKRPTESEQYWYADAASLAVPAKPV